MTRVTLTRDPGSEFASKRTRSLLGTNPSEQTRGRERGRQSPGGPFLREANTCEVRRQNRVYRPRMVERGL